MERGHSCPRSFQLLLKLQGEMHRRDLQTIMELKDDEHFRKTYLLPALEAGLIEMTIPDKPKSSKQRYRITALGETLAAKYRMPPQTSKAR